MAADEPPAGPSRSVAGRVDRVFRRILAVTALLGLVILAVFIYMLGVVRPDRIRYQNADRSLQLAHAALIDEETGLRGFLLTGDSQFLQPYNQGVSAVRDEDVALNRYLGSDPSASSLLLGMRVAQQAWQSEWTNVVFSGLAPTGPKASAAFLAEGKSLFDAYRTQETALDSRISSRSSSLDHRGGLALGAGLAAILTLGALLIATMLQQRRRLRRELVTPVTEIVDATAAIARGDLETQVVIDGPEEFRLIGSGINDMRDALEEARFHDRQQQERVEAQAAQLRSILDMSRQVAGSLNLRYVLRTMGDFATSTSGFERARVWLLDPQNPTMLHTVFGTTGPIEGAPSHEVGIGLIGQSVRYGRPVTEVEGDEASVEVHPERPLRCLAVPLVVGARVIGAIELHSDEPRIMGESTLQVLETLATHAAASIEAARLHGETEVLAQTDALTGLANRRRLDHDLDAECQRAARYGSSLALIMFDVDHFKRFNDTYGHARGDEALQEVANAVRYEVRATDTAYRYGGEEFSVLARETDYEHAMILAERLRRRIEEHFVAHGSPAAVTASFGVGLVPPGRPVPAEMIASADRALYKAKAEGRNRVCGPEGNPEESFSLGV